ncbi:MAG: DUF3999 domain-containing protein [Defluviitaleaceae bacterium]|nr:DUF3999 domain-containing protein [Defluviitaleaceae bacterium]
MKHKKRFHQITWALIGALFFAFTAYAAEANLYSIHIAVDGTQAYKAFALTPEIINHAGTTALRVIDRESGEEVPYFIHSAAYEEAVQESNIAFEFLRRFDEEGYYYLDFRVITTPNTDPLVSHLSLESPQNEFLKSITVLGSHDDQHWIRITNGLVYAVGDIHQTEIGLEGVQRFSYYRLRIPTPQDRVDFMASGIHRQAWATPVPFISRHEAVFDMESTDGISTITIPGLAGTEATMENLRVTGIQIETRHANFKRSVHTEYGWPQVIYRLFFQETELENTLVTFLGMPQRPQIVFTISDYDDRPIVIDRIWVEYAVDYIVFHAEAGSAYDLHFGGGLTRPRYDIENFRDMIIHEGFALAQLQGLAIVINQGPEAQDYGWLFNIAIVLAGVVLTVVAAASFIKNNSKK